MSINLKTAFFAGALTVIASSAGSYVSAQAVSNASNDQHQTAATAVQKAENSKSIPKTDRLPVMNNTVKEQPDQGTPDRPKAMTPDEQGRKGSVPSAQGDIRHVEGRHHAEPHKAAVRKTSPN